MILNDILTGINVVAAGVTTLLMIRFAITRKFKLVYSLVAGFCFYVFLLYAYILLLDPIIGQVTAGIGRGGVLLLLGGILMLSILLDD